MPQRCKAPSSRRARAAVFALPRAPSHPTSLLPDGKYDVIILGTGLKESILSGLLSSRGKKVLHMDRNSYYGGECASLNLTNLYKKFIDKNAEPPEAFFKALGANRDYNVDLVPKFIMANGKLVKVLVLTDVTRYMDFKLVDGSYVHKKGAGIAKVPANESEAIKTGLLGLLQKNWLRGFLKYIAKYDQADPKTWDGMDLSKATMKQLYEKMWLDADAQEFLGHAMALEPDDGYLARPALDCVKSLRLYAESLDRYGKSPFIYPIYGLGNLPEGFSRLCAIHGGIFILNKAVDEILVNPDGTAAGVRSGSGADAEVALAPIIIGDPSYFSKDRVRQTGHVVRLICILSKPVKGIEGDSGQIIIPQKQVGRKNGACARTGREAGPLAIPNLTTFPLLLSLLPAPPFAQTFTFRCWATRTRWWRRASTAPSSPPLSRPPTPRRSSRRRSSCCPPTAASRSLRTS